MKREVKLIFLFTFLLLPMLLFAQQEVQVRGRVVEAETDEPLPGVSIVIENSTRGVTTDVDGTFEIRVNPSDKLVFSFMGMVSQTIEVRDKTYMDVAGQMAGIVSVQQSGEPGVGSNFWIRGVSTFGANSRPLILVDGIERSLDLVDYDDIESFSISKDATATAVYGVRGANGIVLITTKRGREMSKPQINANV
jgi:TonB-dependent outer membrane receptor, SusC/RagA subfamily, signature region